MNILHVTIELTYRCPYECAFCLNPPSRQGHLESELVFSVLEEAAELGATRLIVTGGEPAYHPGITAILRKARKASLSTMIITAGERLADRNFAEILAPVLSLAQVSIHGSASNSNATLTHGRRDLYRKQVIAVKNLIELGVPVRLNMVVKPRNVFDIKPYIAEFYVIGVRQFQFAPCYRLGHAVGKDDLFLSPGQWQFAAESIRDAGRLHPEARIMSEISSENAGLGSSRLDGVCVSADACVRPFESAPAVQAAPYDSIRKRSLTDICRDSPALTYWAENWQMLRTDFHAASVPAWRATAHKSEDAH